MYICIHTNAHIHDSLSSFIHSSMRNKANTQLRYYAFCLHGKCKSLTSLFQKEAFLSHSVKLHSSKDVWDFDGEKLCVVLVMYCMFATVSFSYSSWTHWTQKHSLTDKFAVSQNKRTANSLFWLFKLNERFVIFLWFKSQSFILFLNYFCNSPFYCSDNCWFSSL